MESFQQALEINLSFRALTPLVGLSSM